MARDREWLLAQIPLMQDFLQEELLLTLHPKKLALQTYSSGVDFLGWVNYPYHRVIRTKTKRRMMTQLRQSSSEAALQSYLGFISHGNSYKLRQDVLNNAWILDN